MTRAPWIAAALLSACASIAASPDPRSLVGRALPEPGTGAWAGWAEREGWEVDGDPSPAGSAWRWTVWSRGSEALLVLRAGDEAVDAVRVELPGGWALGTNCRLPAEPGATRDVVAVVTDPPLPPGGRCVFSGARAAWRLDRREGRIVPFPADGLSCQRECPWD
jgi:hypothetical protein